MHTSEPSKSEPNCISTVIKKDGTLTLLCKKTDLIQSANRILTQILPQPLHEHCQVANINNRVITISTDNAVWATQLRYQHQTITKALQASPNFKQIEFVKIRLSPPKTQKVKPCRTPLMSATVSDTINASANSVTNPQLKEALLRLAKNRSG